MWRIEDGRKSSKNQCTYIVVFEWDAGLEKRRDKSNKSVQLWRTWGDLGELCGGIGLGIGLLAVAFFSREAIGFGDGLLFCVTGIYLGFWGNLRLLLTGTLCCALIQAVGLLFRRARMKDRVPLVPFLLLAFVGGGFL